MATYKSVSLTLALIALIGYRYLVVDEESLDDLWHRWNYLFTSTGPAAAAKRDASSPALMEANMTVVIRYSYLKLAKPKKIPK